jgi:hypothetical protein
MPYSRKTSKSNADTVRDHVLEARCVDSVGIMNDMKYGLPSYRCRKCDSLRILAEAFGVDYQIS